jgi:hypothetical protein
MSEETNKIFTDDIGSDQPVDNEKAIKQSFETEKVPSRQTEHKCVWPSVLVTWIFVIFAGIFGLVFITLTQQARQPSLSGATNLSGLLDHSLVMKSVSIEEFGHLLDQAETITDLEDNSHITLKLGEQKLFKLYENPTTGYQMIVDGTVINNLYSVDQRFESLSVIENQDEDEIRLG